MLTFSDMESIYDRETFARSLEPEITFEAAELERMELLLGLCRQYLDKHMTDQENADVRSVHKAYSAITYVIARIKNKDTEMSSVSQELGIW